MTDIQEQVRDPDITYWPEQRWWLAAGSHTDATLTREIDLAHKLGFGGMEFLAMPEAGIDKSRYGWGSEEWTRSSNTVARETTERGMSFSFTCGTNWSNANLPDSVITPEHDAAAKELDFVYEDLKGGESRKGRMPEIDLSKWTKAEGIFHVGEVKEQTFFAALAGRIVDPGTAETGDGAPILDDVIDLSDKVKDGKLEWTAPDGKDNWRMFYFYMHGTGQTAEPSTTTNYTVNYLDIDGVEAVVKYWRDVFLTPEVLETVSKNPRAQMYMDSLELMAPGQGGVFWGKCVADEFRRRRGYSIVPYLPFITRVIPLMMACSKEYRYRPTAKMALAIEKVRFDIEKTWTDLYIENMLKPFSEFLHSVGILLRAEISYGLPFEMSRPGPYVDGIETESLEFGSQIDAYRLLGGVAHLCGKQYSSETGATARNFMLPHRFYDQIINTQLAAGITKTVLHGWASMAGAPGTEWPGHEGMLPVFSERFDLRQPAKEFYPLWTKAIARKQMMLRQGKPRIDIGILRTDHAVDNLLLTAGKDENGFRVAEDELYGHELMRNRKNVWWEDLGMQDAGWSYEYFDGELLLRDDVHFRDGVVQPGGPGYQALIVYQSALDPDVAKHLLTWARKGLKVLFVHGTREVVFLKTHSWKYNSEAAAYTPGLDGRDDELSNTVRELLSLPNVQEVAHPGQTLKALRSLGAEGRNAFTEKNENILTHLRQTETSMILYVYNFLYEKTQASDISLNVPVAGAVSKLDDHSGRLLQHSAAATSGTNTRIDVSLAPGESAIFVIDTSVNPEHQLSRPNKTKVVDLKEWDLVVESWNKGAVKVIKHDSGKGYITEEHRPEPSITSVAAGRTALKPWRDIPQVGPDHSGVGDYTTTFDLPSLNDHGRYELDLGDTSGGLGSVSVNGSTPLGFDTSALKVDVTQYIHKGKNDIRVRVSTSLNNRLMANDYYQSDDRMIRMMGKWPPGSNGLKVRDYGLVGPVVLSVVS